MRVTWSEIPLRFDPVKRRNEPMGLAEKLRALEANHQKVLEFRVIHIKDLEFIAIVKTGEEEKRASTRGKAVDAAGAGGGTEQEPDA